MSASRRITLAVAFSWLSRAVTILANLFLLPILFRFMGKEALGLWFLLGNSQAFLGLLDMGIAPTLMRHIALAKGKSGADPGVELTEESKQQIGDLVVTGRIILQWLAVALFFIAWASGYGLIGQLELKDVSPQTVFWAWTLMCLGYAVGVWVSYLDCWLAGIGYVGWNSLIMTVVSLLTILTSLGAVLLGGGLLMLAVISVVSGLSQRFAILGFIRWRTPEVLSLPGKWNAELAKAMVKPSLYCWLTSLGMFLILKTDQYFIALVSGTQAIPSYNAAYQLVSNLRNIAISFTLASSTFLSQMWQAGELNKINRLVIRNCNLGLIIMGCGVSFLLVAGKEVTDLWLGEDVFIGYQVLLTFCIMFTFEVQNVCLMYSARATENEEYALPSLGAGVLNIIFTMILIKPLGLWGVAMGTLLGQMLTINWYAVYKPLLRLKLYFIDYIEQVLLVWLSSLIFSLLTSLMIKYYLLTSQYNNPWIIVITTATNCGLIFCITLWSMVLSKEQKDKISRRIKQFFRMI
ncbi:MAG: lipopolysaccharide biosynthesis protein [Symplocastrum torsivum CPER-KK1]|jgi:O-antigen/teichoic acid export membrane protein|uniref:Lipopolysaccharide biosynthesis protein n=1 Tax=Symplocastrum torsivum CPER-KK1 TaxID=450513 RepID=A0A951U9L1_9CYAN|nr:lipopolysaccharide biosynthesis protein [Symplocastrum torsivum CPER-KK1]